MISQTLGRPACCRHKINIQVTVILAREGDLRSVWGEDRIHFETDAAGETLGLTAFASDNPQVASVDEGNLGGTNRWFLEQERLCFLPETRGRHCQQKPKGYKRFRHGWISFIDFRVWTRSITTSAPRWTTSARRRKPPR